MLVPTLTRGAWNAHFRAASCRPRISAIYPHRVGVAAKVNAFVDFLSESLQRQAREPGHRKIQPVSRREANQSPPYLPETAAPWIAENLKNALIVNVVLAMFNMFLLPPLDGGRIAVGVLPDAVASPLARLARALWDANSYRSLLFILPTVGAQTGVDVNIVWRLIAQSADAIINAILRLTGN